MEEYSYVDIFATKGLEYMVVLAYFILFVFFIRSPRSGRRTATSSQEGMTMRIGSETETSVVVGRPRARMRARSACWRGALAGGRVSRPRPTRTTFRSRERTSSAPSATPVISRRSEDLCLNKNFCMRSMIKKRERGSAGPEIMVLDEMEKVYDPVYFDHDKHAQMSEMSGGCENCHHFVPPSSGHPACKECHTPEAQARKIQPGLKAAYHRTAWIATREWDTETHCEFCHRKKEGGMCRRRVRAAARRMHRPPLAGQGSDHLRDRLRGRRQGALPSSEPCRKV